MRRIQIKRPFVDFKAGGEFEKEIVDITKSDGEKIEIDMLRNR